MWPPVVRTTSTSANATGNPSTPSDESAKTQQDELGADFTLQTIINSQNDTDGRGQAIRAYLINMELLSVQTNEKVWIGEERIVKYVKQARATW